MATEVKARTRTIGREKLAAVFKTPEMVRYMENIGEDVAKTLPDAVNANGDEIEAAMAAANAAQATANAAITTANDALATAQAVAGQELIAIAPSPDIPNARGLSGTSRLSLTDGGAGAYLQLDVEESALDLANLGGVLPTAKGGTGVATAAAGAVLAGPASGAPAAPAFRALELTDLPTPPAFSAHNNGTAQSIPNNAFTTLDMSTEAFDVGGNFAANAWTPPAGRPVMLTGAVCFSPVAAGASIFVSVFKNGVEYKRGERTLTAAAGEFQVVVSVIDMPSGADVYTLRAYQFTGGAMNTLGAATQTYFQGVVL